QRILGIQNQEENLLHATLGSRERFLPLDEPERILLCANFLPIRIVIVQRTIFTVDLKYPHAEPVCDARLRGLLHSRDLVAGFAQLLLKITNVIGQWGFGWRL